MSDFFLLKDYVRALLLEGKKRDHEDFQILIRLYSLPKIEKLANEIKKEFSNEKEKKQDASKNKESADKLEQVQNRNIFTHEDFISQTKSIFNLTHWNFPFIKRSQ